MDLLLLCGDWKDWAIHADRSEDGWESDYPHWDDIMREAVAAMLEPAHSEAQLGAIELCWAISHESEELSSFAREHLRVVWNVVRHLAGSTCPTVRWQVYEALSGDGSAAVDLLRSALDDEDTYCRRRALLSLARLRPPDGLQIAERFSKDPDLYVRMAARELHEASRRPTPA